MAESARIEIVSVDRIDGDEAVIEFSDGTIVSYAVDELLAMRPHREKNPEDSGTDAT